MARQRILIVEDDTLLRSTLELALEHAGFDCTGAPDGLAALGCMSSQLYDLVLTDMRMPRMTGLELIVAARKLHQPQLCFILLSGYHDYDDRELRDAGVRLVLRKPIPLADLRAHVCAVLDACSHG